jgi:KaiC/GvpD/RAD55 family RecA-like ATPase
VWNKHKVEVVVIDSFSASFFAHDQNDAGATMQHYRDLGKFAMQEVGARACIIITHSTEGSPHKARGSSVHHDVADSIIAVAADKVGTRTVRMVKYRQHRDAASNRMTHMMNPVVITAPDNVTHLVDVDPGGMVLASLPLPKKYQGMAFASMPDQHEPADTNSMSELEGDDDL